MKKKRVPQEFFWGERVLLIFEKVTFFRPSSYFVCSDGLDNPNNFV